MSDIPDDLHSASSLLGEGAISSAPVNAKQVARYLAQNPHFFQQHEALLRQLTLPHPTGKAVSLVERQLVLLRERLADREDHLEDLLDTARHNDMQLSRTRRLIIALMDSQDLHELAATLNEQLVNSFGTEHTRLVLLESAAQTDFVNTSTLVIKPDFELLVLLQNLVGRNRSFCSTVSAKQLELLFEHSVISDGSAAVVPLNRGGVKGYLVLGSENPQYFRAEMGTELTEYVADVIVRLLPHLSSGASPVV
ncbi:hypothetical protein SAMN02745127_01194 [Oceanospirillum multiglobuliferum]|uniref:DUF484 family protein n=1 Tax=Oceanospirillum multiglobuliferum TaxID=64969 RepID=A0A1T4NPV0_9GAMM|nr:DUF484 family protein [Oceanospirillum multiglobuliferum]OPX55728.1 hypothetical protein BTE48_07490 [Oceanospirillum multiglobuliferum]SJZ81086.1 hypothetical protein SAMN02745127_01194 [Oceanospirillum multiglobuliferum]